MRMALVAAAIVVAALVFWFSLVKRVALEGRRWIPLGLIGAAVLLALASLAQGPGWGGGVVAGLTAVLGSGFLFLALLAPQSKQAPAVALGEPLPDFTAPDESGEPFSLASLAGRPVLLKLFRGHW